MQKYVIVDIETTGNSVEKGDRIIQFAAVIIENGKIIDTYSTYINPGIPIPVFITELTGITDELVNPAPTFNDVVEEIENLLTDACFVAHNVHFDLHFIQTELARLNRPPIQCAIIDTVEMTRILMPTIESYKLGDIANFAGFDHKMPHRADSDAYVTAEWFLTLINKAKSLPKQTLYQLSKLSKGLKSNLYFLFHDLLVEKEKQGEPLNDELETFRDIVIRKQKKTITSPLQSPIPYPKKQAEKIHYLQQGFHKEYEQRNQQFAMMDTVYRSFCDSEIALIEAEPGFGKTISYLLPAAIFAINEGKRVVISTHTIQQQQQICDEEIPRIEKMLGRKIHVQLLKGKGNYLNLWKFERMLNEENEHYDETVTKMQLLVWLTETVTGDVDELNLTSGGKHFWHRICHIGLESTKKNPWFEKDFYYQALAKAQNAQIIITNHHFLLADLAGDFGRLPEYEHLIIDEAHHFEKNALKYFGSQLSYQKLRFFISQLGDVQHGKLLGKILRLIDDDKKKNMFYAHDFQVLLQNFSQETEDFFAFLTSMKSKNGRNSSGKNSVRFHSSALNGEEQLIYAWERLYHSYQRLSTALENLFQYLMTIYDKKNEKEQLIIEEFSAFLTDFLIIKEMNEQFFHRDMTEYIQWIEMDQRIPMQSAILYSQPLTVIDQLREKLYTKKKTIIFTSASLTVNGKFTFICEQLGLELFPIVKKKFTASFDHKNIKLIVPNDLPDVSEVESEEYAEEIASYIIGIAGSLKGRLLILFYSYDLLKQTFSLIKESGMLNDYCLLAQGISSGSTKRLMKQFQRFEKAILLGSSTFWEHFDQKGNSLTACIIVRLPFSSPNEPVTYGKMQLVKKRGKNPFYDYSLPEAVIRFKQGFGQLMRGKQDQSWFIVFDQRILKANYGHIFLQSIPRIPHYEWSLDQIILEMEAKEK